MVTMDKVNVAGMSTKFGALISNPLLKGALERNEAAINATTVGTIERIQAIQKALDEALPQEVITAMTMTMKGISEGFRSSLFDISSGLFGIRRMVTGVKAQAFKMTGDIKSDTAEALSLFDMLRDTIGFFAVPFQQLTNILPQIYDPMLGLIDTLIPLRKVGATFSSVFHQFSADYEAFAKEAFPDLKTQSKFLETRGPRAALMAIGALLEDFDPSFSADQTAAELRKLDADFGKVAKDLITRLLNSDVMEMIGETVGNFASELLTVMANLLTGVTDFATTSRFAKGLVKGLEGRIGKDGEKIGMGAWEAIRKIFDKVFEIMGKLLLTIVTQMPMQTALFFGITAVLPAALAALGTKIGATLAAVLSNAGATIQASLLGTKAATTAAAGAGAATTAAVSGGTAQAAITGKAAPVAGAAAAKTGMFAGFAPITAILAPFAKALGIALLVLTAVLGVTVGWETTFKALGMAFDEMKTAIGGTIGPILSGLGETAKGLWDGFWSLVQLFIPLNNTFLDTASETDKLKAAIIAFKIVLWPIVGAFQLLEQFVNVLESAVKIIELFVLALRISLAELNPKNWMGDSAELTSLRKQQKEKETEASATFAKFGQAFERHSAYYTTSVDKAANSVNNLADATDKAKFSFGGPAQPAPAAGIASPLLAPPAPVLPPPPNPIPAIEALSVNQIAANTHLAQIDAKTLPQHQVNPVPPLETIISGLEGAKAYILQVESQITEAGLSVVSEITSSGNATQAKVQETTSAVNSLQTSVQATTTAVTNLSGKLSGPIDVKVVNSPTIKFDMGGMGRVGGSIGNFPKTSGFGMRWGRPHEGNDYGMPVGTKLGIGGPGKVLGAGYWGGYGNTMDIGGPGGMVYRFAHLSKFNAPVGANLPPGYPFALSGNTGNSTGPHLHFEARPGGGGPVNPDAFAGIIRANFAGTPLGPLMGAMKTEMQNMPYGSQLAVSNSDEIFMKPKQMAHVIESSARAGAEGVGNVSMSGVTININGYDKDPKELTDSIASELLTAIHRKSRSEVLTS
jgi:murein DD-endopeptidase MepM/ murein hydrolase activator NlpD